MLALLLWFWQINMGHTRIHTGQIGVSLTSTKLLPSQLQRNYAVRIDGQIPPTFACVPISPRATRDLVFSDVTYEQVEANIGSLLKHVVMGGTVVVVPAGDRQVENVTRLPLKQVLNVMKADAIICGNS